MKDRSRQIERRCALSYAQTTATRTGDVVDVRGYNSATFVVQVGTVTTADATNKFTVDLYHGYLASGTDAVVVPDNEREGAATDVDGTGDVDKTIAFGYLGGMRYVLVKATESGTASAILGATALLADPDVSSRLTAQSVTHLN